MEPNGVSSGRAKLESSVKDGALLRCRNTVHLRKSADVIELVHSR